MTDAEFLAAIQKRIPEFQVVYKKGLWIWVYRGAPQDGGWAQGCKTLQECFIDFAAMLSEECDELQDQLED